VVLAFSGTVGVAAAALAQQQAAPRPYDGIQAGLDAFRLAEEQRQLAVSQQIGLNDQMRFWNGYPTSRGETIYYGYTSPALYAYGAGPLWSGILPAWPARAVFNPTWMYGPGMIYGYPAYYQPARQPIGQQQTQTGASRWESHPVYDPPLTNYRPLPPVDSPLLERTPFAAPLPAAPPQATRNDTIPPPPPRPDNQATGATPPAPSFPTAPPSARRGPREY
jgi:hypothetical protein